MARIDLHNKDALKSLDLIIDKVTILSKLLDDLTSKDVKLSIDEKMINDVIGKLTESKYLNLGIDEKTVKEIKEQLKNSLSGVFVDISKAKLKNPELSDKDFASSKQELSTYINSISKIVQSEFKKLLSPKNIVTEVDAYTPPPAKHPEQMAKAGLSLSRNNPKLNATEYLLLYGDMSKDEAAIYRSTRRYQERLQKQQLYETRKLKKQDSLENLDLLSTTPLFVASKQNKSHKTNKNDFKQKRFQEFVQNEYKEKYANNFEDNRLALNYDRQYLQLQHAIMKREAVQQKTQLSPLLLEYKPETQNKVKFNDTDLITYSKTAKKYTTDFFKTLKEETEKLNISKNKNKDIVNNINKKLSTSSKSVDNGIDSAKQDIENKAKKTSKIEKYSGKYDYYMSLNDDDVIGFLSSFRNGDIEKLGNFSAGVENKYGRSALKDLTSIAKGLAYNDATYGKEARELKNIISAEAKIKGLGKSGNNVFDILQGFKNPMTMVNLGSDFFTDLFTKSSKKEQLQKTKTYAKWVKQNKLNPEDKETYEKFIKDKKSYAKSLKEVFGNEEAMSAIKDANMLGSAISIAILGLTKLSKAAVDFGKAAIASYENIQSLQTRMAVIYGSQSEANTSFNEIEQYAKKSPFGIETMTQQAILLKQSGVAGKDLMNTMQRIGDVASGNAEKMRSVSETFARIMSSTTVTARDMRQLANAGIPAYSALAESLRKNGASTYNYDLTRSANISNASIRSMLQTGKITSEDFVNMIKELTNKGGTFYGATERGAKTILARKQNLADMKQMALAAVGEYLTNMGGAIGVDSWYNTLLKIKEGIWETVENTAKKNVDKRNERTVEEASRLAEVYKNNAEQSRKEGLVASVDADLHKNNPEVANYYRELAESSEKYKNFYTKESEKYSEIAAEAYVSRISYDAQQYEEILEKLQSAPLGNVRKTASVADGTTAQSIQADIINKLLNYQLKAENEIVIFKDEKEILKKQALKLLPQAALVSFEKSLSRGAETVNEFSNSINGAQSRMLKAKTNYDSSSYGSYKLTLQQREEDAQLRQRLNSYNGYFSNGKINNRALKYDAGLLTRANLLKDAASTAEQLPIGFTDLFELVGDNANLKINALSNWQKYSDNITTFAQNFANMTNEFKDNSGLGNSLNILLQRVSESANGNLTKETYQSTTIARMEFEKNLTNIISRLSNKQNRTQSENTLLANLENAKIVFDATGSDIEYDISNKDMLNKRTTPLLIQSILSNAAGVDSAVIRKLSDDNKLSNNQIFKQFVNPMMSKNAFGSLTQSLLSAGMSLKQISQSLKIDTDATAKIQKDINSKLIDNNQLTAYDWTSSLSGLEKLAVQGTLEQRQAVVSSYETQLNQLTDIITKGITTTEGLEDIVDPASELGSALSFATQNVKSGSLEFKDTLLKTVDDMSEELRRKILNLKLDNIVKTALEKENLSVLSNVIKTNLLTRGSSLFNVNQQSFIKNSDVLTTLTNYLLEEARKNGFNGISKRVSLNTSASQNHKFLDNIYLLSGKSRDEFFSPVKTNTGELNIEQENTQTSKEYLDQEKLDKALALIDEKQKNGELTQEQENIWNETLSLMLITNAAMSKYVDSLQALDESTKKLEKTQESLNNQNKLNDIMQNSLGFKNYGKQEIDGSLSSLNGRKNRTPFNSKAEKTYLSVLGYAEDTKLDDVYKSISDNYKNFLDNDSIKKIKEQVNKNVEFQSNIHSKLKGSYLSTVNNRQKIEEELNNISKEYDVTTQDWLIKGEQNNALRVKHNESLSDNALLETIDKQLNESEIAYKNSEDYLINLYKQRQEKTKELSEIQKKENSLKNVSDEKIFTNQIAEDLTWNTQRKNISDELNNYIVNNSQLLGNVGQYLSSGGGEYLLKEISKKNGKESVEYTALGNALSNITSNGEFNGDLLGVANILSQLDDMSLTDKLSEGLSKSVVMTNELTKSWENLGVAVRDAFDTALLNNYISGMKNLGTLQYKVANGAITQEEASKEIKKDLASQASTLLENLSTQMATTGLQIAGAAALSQNWGGVAGGLLLAAAGGIGNFASGILSGYASDSDKDDDKLERIEALKNNLADLIEQARNDATYYESTLRNKSALSFNEAVSATKVNDMILTPQGNFSTSPQDYLIATKNPQSLAGSSPNISFSIVNNGEPVQIESTKQTNTSNGIDLQVVINSMVKKSINDGDYDDTFKSVYLRQQGNIVSA